MSDALGTFAEFHEQPILIFRNGSYISINRCAYSADVIRSSIAMSEAMAENLSHVRSFDDWIDVKDADVCGVFVREANLNTQKLDEFLDEM